MASINQAQKMEEKRKEIEEDLEQAIKKARACGMTNEEITELFAIIMEEP